MQEVRQLGTVTWNVDEIKASIPEFLDLYSKKPINDNQGGMKSPHMFATWFMLKKLNPANVIESGVWKGQGTWLIENALPDCNIFCIDINLGTRKYISKKAKYFDKDFSKINWDFLKDKEDTVLFFDDHQNAVQRIKQGKEIGFKNFIFEDNYPAKHGDCYSLKKAFQHDGFNVSPKKGLKNLLKEILKPTKADIIPANSSDAAYLKSVLSVYYEFPPIFKKKLTRFKAEWNDDNYPTPEPIYSDTGGDDLKLFKEEAGYYTWICFAKLK